MKHIPILACILSAACALSSCAVETTYIGKAYPATDNPELFFSWNDAPGDYETMGHRTATTKRDAAVSYQLKATLIKFRQ